MRRVLLAVVICFFLLGCPKKLDQFESNTDFLASEKIEPIESLQPTYTKEDCTLIGSFSFYQGNFPMNQIESITFTRKIPSFYDEKWSASSTGANCLTGYRFGKEVFIVGETIYASNRCSYMFAGHNKYGDELWSNLKSITGLELLDTSNVTNMKLMFAYTQLEQLTGIEYWDVAKVTNFSGMFQSDDHTGATLFTDLPIDKWNTSSAVSMSHMFYGCSQLETIPVDSWDVSKVETFSHMFADCYNLSSLNLSNWNTASARSFDGFLNDCHSLERIDVSGIDTSKVIQFSQMFENCYNLQQIIGLNEWDVSKACYYAFSETFCGCHSLISLDLSNWRAEPDNTARMFKNCKSLDFLDISGMDLSKAITIEMYDGCENLKIS